MSRRPDDELEELLGRDRGLGLVAKRLRSARLKVPPLDPSFRMALRRKLMAEAYVRQHKQSRPGLLAGLFTGPRFAFASGAIGLLLIAAVFAAYSGGNLFAPAAVTVTTIGATRPVSVDRPILVSFSQPMDHQSVEQAIQIEPATQVTYQWQGNNLVIQPASGQLAPNTQYHITVAADAKTAQAKKLGQPATVAVNTAPLPSASPSPVPSPTARPQPAITSERNLAPSGTPIAWSADGSTLYYLTAGDLNSIRNDGTGQKSLLAGGVSAAALSPDGLRILVLQAGKVALLTIAGAGLEILGPAPSASGVGFQAGKPIYWSIQNGASFFSANDQQPIASTPFSTRALFLSPEGGRAVLLPTPSAAGASVILYELGGSKLGTPWPIVPSSNVAWSPDSTRVAFLASGSVLVGGPDGTGAKAVLGIAEPSAEIAWTPGDKLLVVSSTGTWLVNPDGSGFKQVRKTPVGYSLTWSPGANRAALVRDGAVWEVEIGTARSELDLVGAGAFVDQYEQARIKGDLAIAGSLLTASGARMVPTPPAGDLVLSRYFVIASQATADDVHFTVRLIYSKGSNEVRYVDEVLILVATGSTIRIDSVLDSAANELRRGPTVISVQSQGVGKLVVTFDSDLRDATVTGNVRVLADGTPVASSVLYGSRKITVTAPLVAGHKYQLVISTGMLDISGQALQSAYSYDFVAAASPSSPGD